MRRVAMVSGLTVVFHDGQGLIVPADSGVATLADLNGKAICVGSGTTPEQNLNDVCTSGIPYTPIKYQDLNQVVGGYLQGRCQAMTSDRSQLAAARSGFDEPNAHVIAEDRLSKEPLAPAVVGGDQRSRRCNDLGDLCLDRGGGARHHPSEPRSSLRAAEADPTQGPCGVRWGLMPAWVASLDSPMISSCRPFGPRAITARSTTATSSRRVRCDPPRCQPPGRRRWLDDRSSLHLMRRRRLLQLVLAGLLLALLDLLINNLTVNLIRTGLGLGFG